MKVRVLLLAAIGSMAMLATRLQAADDGWLDDFKKAKKEAVRKGRPILADFTGSDWCGWCVKLDKEVFSEKAFQDYAKKNVVLFVADFPRAKKTDERTMKQNKELMETYGIRGFPTILLVDPDGEVIARTGYQKGGAEAYVEHLKELLKDYVAPEPVEDGKTKRKGGSRSSKKSGGKSRTKTKSRDDR